MCLHYLMPSHEALQTPSAKIFLAWCRRGRIGRQLIGERPPPLLSNAEPRRVSDTAPQNNLG